MTLYCAAGCRTKLGRYVVADSGWATFFFDPKVESWWDGTVRAFFCGPCLPRGPVVAEAC